ncbi:MAG: T9SS type A sorting domain-containing protein [Bacteroidetes bacterium]|nr:T9SS type A sorting domain-containing protein [Bacteroidota bacterium]
MVYIGTSNSYGCQSTEEVLESCEANSVAIVENHLIRECMVSPNPFKGFTTFSYILEKPSKIIITIFNPQGQIIDKIQQGQAKGKQKVRWNATGLPAGMYFYRFQAGNRDYMWEIE